MREVGSRSRLMPCPPERLNEMFRLRATVWIGEGADPASFPGGEWRNERDASRLHWIVLEEDRVVATASLGLYPRLVDVEDGEAYVERGAVIAGTGGRAGQSDGGGGLSGPRPRQGPAGRSGDRGH